MPKKICDNFHVSYLLKKAIIVTYREHGLHFENNNLNLLQFLLS